MLGRPRAYKLGNGTLQLMMSIMNEEIKNKIISFAENSKKLVGLKLSVSESISRNKDNFDRHFTTFSNFSFVMTDVMIRTSGAKIMLMGTDFNYEIDTGALIKLTEESKDQYCFIEALSEKVFRRSVLSFTRPS